MDPKNPADLDPKLKEIYERVMGTNVASSQAISQKPAIPTTPQQSAIEKTPQPQAPQAPAQTTSTPIASPQSIQEKTSTGKVFLEHQSFKPQPQKTEEKKQQNMLPMLLFVGGIVFFAVYAFFWLKFFNVNLISLPF